MCDQVAPIAAFYTHLYSIFPFSAFIHVETLDKSLKLVGGKGEIKLPFTVVFSNERRREFNIVGSNRVSANSSRADQNSNLDLLIKWAFKEVNSSLDNIILTRFVVVVDKRKGDKGRFAPEGASGGSISMSNMTAD